MPSKIPTKDLRRDTLMFCSVSILNTFSASMNRIQNLDALDEGLL